jgi:lysophospholipase L1-like esterase
MSLADIQSMKALKIANQNVTAATNLGQSIGINWVIGGIDGTTGINVTANYMLRTPNYIRRTDTLTFNVPSGFSISVIKYVVNSNKYYSYASYSSTFAYSFDPNYSYKFTFVKTGSTTPIADVAGFLRNLVVYISNNSYTNLLPPTTKGSHLINKSCNFVGDSITQQNRYVQRVTYNTGVANHNYGVAGCTMAVNGTNTSLTSQSVVERVTGINGNTAIPDAQIWTLEAGVNDWYYNSPLGTITDTVNTTFYGAYNLTIQNILGRPNHPKLILFTLLQSNRDNQNNTASTPYKTSDINTAIIALANKYSLPYVDLWNKGGLNQLNISAATNPTTIDGIHPNDLGTSMFAPLITQSLLDLDFDYLNYTV